MISMNTVARKINFLVTVLRNRLHIFLVIGLYNLYKLLFLNEVITYYSQLHIYTHSRNKNFWKKNFLSLARKPRSPKKPHPVLEMTNNAKYKQKTDLGTKKMDMVYVRYCGAEDDFKFKKTPEECLKKVKPKRSG